MKRFLLTTTLILSAFFMYAQISITVSGQVNYTDGSPASEIDIYISTDSMPTWQGYWNMVETAADGSYTDTFEVPSGLTQGQVYIALIDCDGTYNQQTSFWSPVDMPSADFTYCDIQQQSCAVYIYADSINTGGNIWTLTASTSGVAPYSYVWSTGETTASIGITESAEYCVTITDALGCEASDCYNLTIPDCGVSVEPTAAGLFYAVAFGEAPYTYLWNTGETTESILPTTTGNYCVTITANNGCESAACYYYWEPQDTTCSVYIFEDQIGYLIASGSGVAPFTYSWSTGDSSSYINPTDPGTYCVTLTDAIGCSSVDCYEVESNEPTNFSISGYIYPEDTIDVANLQGWVYLYELDQQGVPGPAIDSLPFGNAAFGSFYIFDTLNTGSYIVKAVVDPNTPETADYFPTYHESTTFWQDADVITLPYAGTQYFNIILIETDGLQGPGNISGLVLDLNGLIGSEIDERSEGGFHNATIILTDESDALFLYQMTNEEGNFNFENLPYGTYRVHLEITGIEKVYATVTIGPDQPNAQVRFEVDNQVVTSTEDLIEAASLLIAPNITDQNTTLVFDLKQSSNVGIQLVNTAGQIVLVQNYALLEGTQNIELDLSRLNSGLYLLNIVAEGQNWTRKLIKK